MTKTFHKIGIRGKYLTRYEEAERIRMMAALPKTKTYHEGANDERTAILAKVRREIKKNELREIGAYLILEQWLLQRNERYRKNPGGL